MILLTGGSGFIGSHFQQYLDQREIVNLDLNNPTFTHVSKFVKGDIRVKEDVRRAVSGNKINLIISLAAKHHDFGIGHNEYFDTNETGTSIICDVATEFDIHHIIFYSSVAVYGLRDEISTENTEPAPDSPYGASKLAGEKVLLDWCAKDKRRSVLIIRPTLVFGPNNLGNMYNLIRQIDSGIYFHLGKADNIKSIAYVENLVQATLFLRERMKPGVQILNYADEPQLNTKTIANTIAAALGKSIRISVPKRLGVLLAFPFDVVIKITNINLPISSARIRKLAISTHHSAEKIFSMGFQPRFSTVQGLGIMVRWYQEKKRQ